MNALSKYSLIAIAVVLLNAACNRVIREDEDESRLDGKTQRELELIKEQCRLNDSLQIVFAQTLNEIDHNLDLIREKEGVLVLGPESTSETGITKTEHIRRNISIINSLMEQNKEKLRKLTAQVKKSKIDNALLTKLTQGTKERISKQEEEIALLKTQLTDKSFDLEKLNMRMNDVQLANAMLQDKSDKLDKDVHSAYYTVGSYDELTKENVLTKEGGVLGIGKKKILKDDFKKDYFTEVDVRQAKAIPVFAKKAKLVTYHPRNSYKMTKVSDQITYLEITNSDEFWKASKYLVVEVQM